MSSVRFILLLTLRLEIYTNIIVVPLVNIFGKLTGGYSPEANALMSKMSIMIAGSNMIIAFFIRAIVLGLLLRKVKKETGDPVRVKRKVLNYPRFEAIVISIRWTYGLLATFVVMYMAGYSDLSRLPTYLLDMVMCATVNAVISYFATENMMSKVLTTARIASTPMPAGTYSLVGIAGRLLMTVSAVLLPPLIIFGYLIVLLGTGKVKFEQYSFYIIFVIAMAILSLIVILFESTRGIRKGMKGTIGALEQLEKGEFNIGDLPMLDRSEIGAISQYVNFLGMSLRSFVSKSIELNRQLGTLTVKLTFNAENLSQSMREEATSMEEIMATTEEISSGAESVTQSVNDQFTSIESLIQSMAKLSDVMGSVVSRIESVIKISGEIESTAGTSVSSLNAMIESMKIVSESSSQMTNIIEIINDISDKINLLSLNASIEAARAGEAGRGFAVVADEISKLADMTANSIKDISSLVQRNIDEIRTGNKRIDDAVAVINTITKLVNSINLQAADISSQMTTQRNINSKVNDEAGIIKEKSEIVKQAMQEQEHALLEITKAIANINQSTQTTVDSTDNLFRSAKEVEVMAEGLVKE